MLRRLFVWFTVDAAAVLAAGALPPAWRVVRASKG
jgi:hypothetical protein